MIGTNSYAGKFKEMTATSTASECADCFKLDAVKESRDSANRSAHIWQFIAASIFIGSMVWIGMLKVDIYKAETARIFAQEQTLRASASMVRAWKQSGNQCAMCH